MIINMKNATPVWSWEVEKMIEDLDAVIRYLKKQIRPVKRVTRRGRFTVTSVSPRSTSLRKRAK